MNAIVDRRLQADGASGIISKAVIPVAGLGTRLTPAAKQQPKEMHIADRCYSDLDRVGCESLCDWSGEIRLDIGNSEMYWGALKISYDYAAKLGRLRKGSGCTKCLTEILKDREDACIFPYPGAAGLNS